MGSTIRSSRVTRALTLNAPARTARSILIASDNVIDAALVRKLLSGSFDDVFVSTDPDKIVEDYEHRQSRVLVLAFDALAKAERYCLTLYRVSRKVHLQAHRTVILCGKEEVGQVAELCIARSFDDYVLFWPMNHDAPRLRMAVHHALRELGVLDDAVPSAAEFAVQARRLAELEGLLDRQLKRVDGHVEAADRAIDRAEQDIGIGLDSLARQFHEGALREVVEVKDLAGLNREMARFKGEHLRQRFGAVQESLQSIHGSIDETRQEYAPHMKAARALNEMALRVRATIMIVDDDDFQRKMLARILEPENYRLVFAASGAEALNLMRKTLPDLVLMDVQMPNMNGIETTRRLKSVPLFANVAVIMLTGRSEGSVVVDSLSVGAVDFVVKPVDRVKLLAKVARWSPLHGPDDPCIATPAASRQ